MISTQSHRFHRHLFATLPLVVALGAIQTLASGCANCRGEDDDDGGVVDTGVDPDVLEAESKLQDFIAGVEDAVLDASGTDLDLGVEVNEKTVITTSTSSDDIDSLADEILAAWVILDIHVLDDTLQAPEGLLTLVGTAPDTVKDDVVLPLLVEGARVIEVDWTLAGVTATSLGIVPPTESEDTAFVPATYMFRTPISFQTVSDQVSGTLANGDGASVTDLGASLGCDTNTCEEVSIGVDDAAGCTVESRLDTQCNTATDCESTFYAFGYCGDVTFSIDSDTGRYVRDTSVESWGHVFLDASFDLNEGCACVPTLDGDGDGVSLSAGDCNDSDATVFPNAPESCDNIDSDCDETFADEFDDLDGDDTPDCIDDDADGDGQDSLAAGGTDCDDLDATQYDGATEADGQGVDLNCDGAVLCFADTDGDSEGASSDGSTIALWVGVGGELDIPTDGGESPTLDRCDRADADDAIQVADWDGSTYSEGSEDAADTSSLETDCDDADAATNAHDREATRVDETVAVDDELPDKDTDCDGSVTCASDDDGDGYGADKTDTLAVTAGAEGQCAATGGLSERRDDCDDEGTDAAVRFPNNVETCGDTIDQDCDGSDETCAEVCANAHVIPTIALEDTTLDLTGGGSNVASTTLTNGCPDGSFLNVTGVWYTYTASGGDVTLVACSDDFTPQLSVFTGAGCGSLTCTAETTSAAPCSSGTGTQITIPTVNGEDLYIFVHGATGGDTGTFDVDINETADRDDDGDDATTDCDDDESTTFNGADEGCDDVDSDCDGVVDDGLDDCTCTGEPVSCACDDGYEADGSGLCVDIDECSTGTPCENSGACTNTAGGFTCDCPGGFDGDTCEICAEGYSDDTGAIDNCLPDNDTCDNATDVALDSSTSGGTSNATVESGCHDTDGPGIWYSITGDGGVIEVEICPDPDTAVLTTDVTTGDCTGSCSTVTTEALIETCSGGDRFAFDSDDGTVYRVYVEADVEVQVTISVTDIDADDDGFGTEGVNVDCRDNDDSIFPGAPEGCDNVDSDCDGSIDDTLDDCTCTGTTALDDCSCDSGYELDGGTPDLCVDTDECSTGTPCQNGGSCTNTDGGFTCDCATGYIGDTCTECDTDEGYTMVDGVCVPGNANCSTAPPLADDTPMDGSTSGASLPDTGECGDGVETQVGVWYEFLADGGQYSIEVCATNPTDPAPSISVYDDDCNDTCSGVTPVETDTPSCTGGASGTIIYVDTDNATHHLYVSGTGTDTAFDFTIEVSDVDVDNDGYRPEADGGEDCDDADATISPDGSEICDDEDTDCDDNFVDLIDQCECSGVGETAPCACGTGYAGDLCDTCDTDYIEQSTDPLVCVLDEAGLRSMECSNATVVDELPYVVTSGSNSGGTDLFNIEGGPGFCDGVAISQGLGGREILYSFTPGVTATYRFEAEVLTTDLLGVLYIFPTCDDPEGTCVNGVEFDDLGGVNSVEVELTGGVEYLVAVDGQQPVDVFNYNFTITCPALDTPNGLTCSQSPGDVCETAFELTEGVASAGDTTGLTNDYNVPAGSPPVCGTNIASSVQARGQNGADEAFSYTAAISGDHCVIVDPTFISMFYVATDCNDIAGTCFDGEDENSTGVYSETVNLTVSETYFIIVDSAFSGIDEGSFTIRIDEGACP